MMGRLVPLLFLLPALARAQGFDVVRRGNIDRILQEAVDSNRIGGAVALVMQGGKVVYQRAVGWSDREAQRRMTPDAIFRIASQTKALTSVAIMMLIEEGRIKLGDRVSRFILEYARTAVASSSDTGRVIACEGPPPGGPSSLWSTRAALARGARDDSASPFSLLPSPFSIIALLTIPPPATSWSRHGRS